MSAAWGEPALVIVGFAAPVTRRRRRSRRARRWTFEAGVIVAYAAAALAFAPGGGTSPAEPVVGQVVAEAPVFPGAKRG